MAAFSPINQSLILIPKRAESRGAVELRETFVDSGIATSLLSVDHQVIYGRRGTGKTHALRYLQQSIVGNNEVGVYIDLRQIGSPESLLLPAKDHSGSIERAARLLVDIMSAIHDTLLELAVTNEALLLDEEFVHHLDQLAASISSVRIEGDVELSREGESSSAGRRGGAVKLGLSGSGLQVNTDVTSENTSSARSLHRESRKGRERRYLNFADVSKSLSQVLASAGAARMWLLLDEWGSIPLDTQPYVAEFLARTVLPIQRTTVKIAAIEQQTRFRARIGERFVGIELGADVTANLDFDDFLTFDQDAERARAFFADLLRKHLLLGSRGGQEERRQLDVLEIAFAEVGAFDEWVRSAEGVPRDAINIASKAAMLAGTERLTRENIQRAALTWFHSDKERAISDHTEARKFLGWITNEITRKSGLRTFYIRQQEAMWSGLLKLLFESRVIHLIRRGLPLEEEPLEQFNLYALDYVAHSDAMRARSRGMPQQYEADLTSPDVSVPALVPPLTRSAVVHLDDFDRFISPTPPSNEPTDDQIELRTRYDNRHTATIMVAGEIDMLTSPQFRAEVLEALESGHTEIYLEVAQVTFLGTSGLAVFTEIREAIYAYGGSLVIRNAARRVLRPLTISGMVPLLEFEWDE